MIEIQAKEAWNEAETEAKKEKTPEADATPSKTPDSKEYPEFIEVADTPTSKDGETPKNIHFGRLIRKTTTQKVGADPNTPASEITDINNREGDGITKARDLKELEEKHEFCDMGKMRKRRRQLAVARKNYSEDLEKASKAKAAEEAAAKRRKLVFKISLHVIMTLLNLAFLVNYLTIDYLGFTAPLVILDFVLSVIFLVDFIYNFLQLTIPFSLYLSHIDNLVDIITLLPPVFHLFMYFLDLNDPLWTLPDMFNSTRVLRFYRTFNKLREETRDEQSFFALPKLTEEIVNFVLRIFIILFVCAGLVLFFVNINSNSSEPLFAYPMHFWDALYFCLVTFTTIGYGCIRPTKIESKYFVLGLIFAVMVTFANQITGLAEVLQKLKGDVLKFRKGYKHIVIYTPSDDVKILMRFLSEYYLTISEEKVNFLVLSNEPLSKELAAALLNPKYNEKCLGFLRANKVDKAFLEKCNMLQAKTLFILASQHSVNPEMEDSNVIFFVRLMHEQYQIGIPTYVVLAESDEKLAIKCSPSTETESQTLVNTVNISAIKYKIMAKHIFTRGFIPLVEALLTNTEQYLKGNFPSPMKFQHSINHVKYIKGLPEYFVGQYFSEVVKVLYRGTSKFLAVGYPRILLLGIITKIEEKGKEKQKLFINPFKYKIRAGDLGYMLHFTSKSTFEQLWTKLCDDFDILQTNIQIRKRLTKLRTLTEDNKVFPTDPVLNTEREILKNELNTNKPEDNPFMTTAAARKAAISENSDKSDDNPKSILNKVLKAISKNQPKTYKCNLRSGHKYILSNEDLKSKIEGHIIVCGFHKGLRHFVKSVRDCSNLPICFLFEDETPPALYKLYTKHKSLFHFQGSADDLTSLTNAGVENAFHVLVLSSMENCQQGKARVRDLRAIMTTRLILNFFKGVHVTAEMKDFESLELMDYVPIESQRKFISYTYWPNYMMGRVFVSGLLDAFSSSAYNNPYLLTLLESILKTSEAGDACVRRLGISECGNLHSFRIPKNYTSKRTTFEVLFNDLLDFDFPLIVIGLFCCPMLRESTADIMTWNEFINLSYAEVPLLYLNPAPETVLNVGDFALCIGFTGVDFGPERKLPRKTVSRRSLQGGPKDFTARQQNFNKLMAELNRRINGDLQTIKEEDNQEEYQVRDQTILLIALDLFSIRVHTAKLRLQRLCTRHQSTLAKAAKTQTILHFSITKGNNSLSAHSRSIPNTQI
eukprot:TRINITY_DN1156_c0_g1_i3.p1 TRINITY_DN1156_c0_g1~~TRINITY_DN1156_c0_g1_i3.p1  ORF type:complete len:1216 (+),score=116.59 TRINITY_DN1156_c0_g1_i3:5481-9128(+)